MFRKLKQLVSFYDKKFFAWLEGKNPEIRLSNSRGERPTIKGSIKSRSSMEDAGNKVQVPDPWD